MPVHGYIKHNQNVVICLAGAVVFYTIANAWDLLHLHFDWLKILFYAIGCLFSYWLTFDLLFNLFAELPIFHTGTEAWLDKIQSKIPIPQMWLFFKFLFAFMGIYMYYNVDLLWAF